MATDYGSVQANALLGGGTPTTKTVSPVASSPVVKSPVATAPTAKVDYGSDAVNKLLGGAKASPVLPGINVPFTADQQEQYGTITPPKNAKVGDNFKADNGRSYTVQGPSLTDIADHLYKQTTTGATKLGPLPLSSKPVDESTPTSSKFGNDDILKTLWNIPKGIVEGELNPSQDVLDMEKQIFPQAPTGSGLVKQAYYNAPAILPKLVFRFFGPILAPAGQDIAAAIGGNSTFLQNKLNIKPDETLKAFPALEKSKTQLAGDAAQVLFSIIGPSEILGTAGGVTEATVKQAFITGAKTGALNGLGFGVAQAMSSGSNDPDFITKTITNSVIGMALLSGLTSSATPAAKAMTKQVIEKYNLPQNVFIDADTVRAIVSGRDGTSEDISTLYRATGRTAEEIKTDINNGISIKIPLEKVITLEDQPWWATLKKGLGLTSDSQEMGRSFSGEEKPGQGPRALLDAPSDSSLNEYYKNKAQEVAQQFKSEPVSPPVDYGSDAVNTLLKPVEGALTPYDTKEVVEARNKAKEDKTPTTDTINTPERVALRKQITDTLYGDGAKVKGKRLDIVMGGPGSRKSTMIANPLAEEHGSIIADSDKAKAQLPEFGEKGEGAGKVHQESANINSDILNKGFSNGDNIVYPTVGKTLENINKIIDHAKSYGYDVHLHHADLSLDKSIPSTIERWKAGHQGFVDPHYGYNEVGLRPKENYGILKNDERLTSTTSYNVDVERGQKPQVLETRGEKQGRLATEQQGLDGTGEKGSSVGSSRTNDSRGINTKETRLGQSVQEKALEAKLKIEFEDQSQYSSINIKDQSEKALKLIQNDYEQAKRIAFGHENAPGDLKALSVFSAVEQKALADGDIETLLKLANSSIGRELSESAQNLRLARERDPNSAVNAIMDVNKSLEETAKKRVKNITKAKKDVVNEIKKEIKKATPKKQTWNDFINSITC